MNTPTLLKPAEAAQKLGMSLRSVYRLIDSGELPAVSALTPAGPRRIRLEDLAAFVAKRTAA